MRPTQRLAQNALRITLFSHERCSLCTTAKQVLERVQARRPFDYQQIDVMQPGNETWKNQYAFDVPVIHVQQSDAATRGETVPATQKLMHRFSEDQVEQKMDVVGGSNLSSTTNTTNTSTSN